MWRALTIGLVFTVGGCFGGMAQKPAYAANPQILPLEPITVFQNSSGPLSYQAAQLADVNKVVPVERVQGRACQRGFSIPVLAAIDPKRATGSISAGWGQGAYQDALDDARKGLPVEAVLYDVRVDLNLRMILTIYRELCLRVDAAVATPSAVPVPASEPPAPQSPEPVQPEQQPSEPGTAPNATSI